MTGNFSDDIDEAMNLLEIPGSDPIQDHEVAVNSKPYELVQIKSNIDNLPEDLKADYMKIRQSSYSQQQMIETVAEIAMNNAKVSDAPRMVEVFSGIMTTWANVNKDLLKMHKDVAEIMAINKQQSPQVINNTQTNIMYGTSNDMIEKFGSQFDQQLKADPTTSQLAVSNLNIVDETEEVIVVDSPIPNIDDGGVKNVDK